MKVAVVVGNPKPQSRTAHIAMSLVEQIFGPVDSELIELSSHADKLFSWPSDEMAALNQRVAESNIAVFASPTYKATYTGLLKAFLDLLPHGALKGKAVLPLATGGSPHHMLALDYALRPVLQSLGARHILPGVYASDAQVALTPEGAYQLQTELTGRLADAVHTLATEGLLLQPRMPAGPGFAPVPFDTVRCSV